MKHKLLAALFVSLGFMLSGCGDSDKPAANASAAKPQDAKPAEKKAEKPSNSEADWQAKTQAYIRLNNRLIGFNSQRNETFAKWAAASEEKVKKGDFKSIRSDSHYFSDSVVKDLQTAVDLPGNIPEVDAAAKNLLAVVAKYLPNWKELESYNKSKKYEDDKGAKGEQMLPMYREGIEALRKATSEFDAKVDVIAKQSHEKALAKYKAEGKLLEMHTWEAMGAAQKIIESFESADDLKNQAKIEAANAQLAIMETNVDAMKAEHAKRKAEAPKSLPMIDRYDSVQSSLVDFAGKYREARKNPRSFNDAVGKYNDAISALNMMQR